MGCVCCSLSSFVSILLDALERISLCTVCAMLTCCLLLTIMTMMVLGIGIGYHYCFVQSSVEAMEKAAQASRGGSGGQGTGGMGDVDAVRTIDRAMKKSIAAHRVKRARDMLSPLYNNTLFVNNTAIDRATKESIAAHRVKRARDMLSPLYNNTPFVNNTAIYPSNDTSLNIRKAFLSNRSYLVFNATNLTAALL